MFVFRYSATDEASNDEDEISSFDSLSDRDAIRSIHSISSDESSNIDESISSDSEPLTCTSVPPAEVYNESNRSPSPKKTTNNTILEKLLSQETDADEKKRIKNHRRRLNPRRVSLAKNNWDDCAPEHVERLPHDIDGKVIYVLSFDPAPGKRMKSTVDGRNWEEWRTSNRKGFNGMRRITKCKGGWKCTNKDCKFFRTFQRENSFYVKHVPNSDPGKSSQCICTKCEKPCEQLRCSCTKVWEFDDSSITVTVFHDGKHECIARRITSTKTDETKLRDIFKTNSKTTPLQAGRGIIIDALDDPNLTADELFEIVDSAIDTSHIKYVKQKTRAESRPFGHSYEAVGQYRAKMQRLDKFLVYKINSKALNGDTSYVFKTSKRQLDIAISMDCDENGPLKDEYMFFDGTFKRCPGFVTLAGHVFMDISCQIVKLFTMETDSESTECVSLCWRLFNEALSERLGKPYRFNPSGWSMDEGQGMWKGLEDVYGEDAAKKCLM